MESKTILITGAAGSIGSELTRQLAPKNRLWLIDIDETRLFDLVEELKQDGYDVSGQVVDVRDAVALRKVFHSTTYTPAFDLVLHTAARKHVTPMEEVPMEAVSVNIEGTYNLIEICKANCVQNLINISTDKVVNADCIMGATKKVSELMVKNAGYTSVRFGNVMGSRGSVIPIWQKQADSGKPLTITDERMERFMMTIEEACRLVIEAASMDDIKRKVVMLDMGKPVKILDLAKQILGKERGLTGTRLIGIRAGEKLSERLMSPEEESLAQKKGKFFIL